MIHPPQKLIMHIWKADLNSKYQIEGHIDTSNCANNLTHEVSLLDF